MKKILPPQLFYLTIAIMAMLFFFLPVEYILTYPYNLLGIIFVAIGLLTAIAGKKQFLKLKTNIKTFNEPDMLVSDGLFAYSRNPMYLGFSLAIIGFSVLFGNLSSMVAAVVFIVLTDRWYIRYEEKVMREKFGDEYEDYCQRTRRWI